MSRTKRMFGAAMMAGAMSVAIAAPASAQRPPVVIGGGLVNVQIADVIDDVTVTVQDVNVNVGVALNLAANVCGVAVGVLAEQLGSGTATCDSLVDGSGQIVTINR